MMARNKWTKAEWYPSWMSSPRFSDILRSFSQIFLRFPRFFPDVQGFSRIFTKSTDFKSFGGVLALHAPTPASYTTDLRAKRQRWDFCEESMVWYFETKCADVKFAEPWMWKHFPFVLREHRYVGSAMCPECPTKIWRGKVNCLNPRKSGSDVIQGLGGVTTSDRVWSRLGVEPEALSEIAVDRDVFQVLLGLLPRDPP